MKQKTQKIGETDQKIIDILLNAEGLYDAILSQLKIDRGDFVYRELVLGMLKRQTKDQIVFGIWGGLGAEQLRHLREYMSRAFVIAPWMSHEDILMEFAMMYPELMKKVYSGLSGFLKGFIEKFNEIDRA